jgi:hypothetical protein
MLSKESWQNLSWIIFCAWLHMAILAEIACFRLCSMYSLWISILSMVHAFPSGFFAPWRVARSRSWHVLLTPSKNRRVGLIVGVIGIYTWKHIWGAPRDMVQRKLVLLRTWKCADRVLYIQTLYTAKRISKLSQTDHLLLVSPVTWYLVRIRNSERS